MKKKTISALVLFLAAQFLSLPLWASAYNARPKLTVVVVVDQLRGDILERYHDQLQPEGFRLLLDHGAWFRNCYYQYINTETAPGHATISTGAYTLGHGILANEWFDPKRNRMVSSVEDDNVQVVGANISGPSASPHNLQTDTLGDELRLSTGGQAKVFAVALKDRASILPGGFSANGAFWIDHDSGTWISSTFYMKQLPAWATAFNQKNEAKSYFDKEWKASDGKVLWKTSPQGKSTSFYDLVGPTPYANEYTLNFAKSLIEAENLGSSSVSDLLFVSFSSHDILGHRMGPDSTEEKEMILALDRQLQDFFSYLIKRYGRDNLMLALAADHGVAPVAEFATNLRIPAQRVSGRDYRKQLNDAISEKTKSKQDYVLAVDYPKALLNEKAFATVNMKEAEAEKITGEAMKELGSQGYITKLQLAKNEIPDVPYAAKLANSYSNLPSWYVIGYAKPFTTGPGTGTGHGSPYAYDSHIPLAIFGPEIAPGIYDEPAEPTDLAVTLSEILGINHPAASSGKVLWRAIHPQK